MVARLLRHLSREMVHTVEKNAVIVGIINLLNKIIFHDVKADEWFLDRCESSGEINRPIIVCRDVTDSHQSRFTEFVVLLEFFCTEHSWVLSLPVHTVDKEIYIWQILMELSSIILRIFIIVFFVKRLLNFSCNLSNKIFCLKLRDDNLLIIDITRLKISLQVVRLNFLMW